MVRAGLGSLGLLILLTVHLASRVGVADEEKVPLKISGGHETDPRDRGRPVVLVAGALGVKPDVFRSAFSKVKPAPAGTRPDPAQVRRNKSALLGALAPLGVTNERLDEVSNYYRYVPGRGALWPVQSAAGYATLADGVVTSIVITEAGSGYSSPPTVSVPGRPEVILVAELAFGREFEKNGSVASVARAKGAGRPR